jgi:hypothetical protein
MSKGRILIIGSNATRIEVQGGTGPTGQYLNETVIPAMAFLDAGMTSCSPAEWRQAAH